MKGHFLNNRGSLTLEGVIVFPFFLTLIFLLINFINVSMVYIAMEHAVSETVKQIATHAYPLCALDPVKPIGVQDLTQKILTDPETIKADLPKQLGNAIVSDITTMMGNHINEILCGNIEPVITKIAEKKIRDFYPLASPDQDSFKIVKATMYNPLNTTGSNGPFVGADLNNEDVALAVEYKVALPVPFFLKEITLSSTVVERAWVDDV